MNFIEDNWEYINATATARAIEIAYATNCWDIDDYKQSMFLVMIKRGEKYNPRASSPTTFINVVMYSAKNTLLRHWFGKKNQLILNTENIEQYA